LKVGRDGGLEPRADLLLGIGRLGAKVPTGVADGVMEASRCTLALKR